MNTKRYMTMVATGLACAGLLTACGTDKMKDEMESSKMEMSSEMKKDDMKDDMSKEKMDGDMKEETMASSSMMEEGSEMMNEGQMALDFSLEDVNGKTYRLSELKGKKVYLKFWASWCSICLASLEETNELAKMAADDVVVLSVVSPDQNGEKSAEDFKKWYKELGYDALPVLLDSKGDLLKEYMVRSYPTNVFIGTDGVLVKTQAGFMDQASIEKTLAEIK